MQTFLCNIAHCRGSKGKERSVFI